MLKIINFFHSIYIGHLNDDRHIHDRTHHGPAGTEDCALHRDPRAAGGLVHVRLGDQFHGEIIYLGETFNNGSIMSRMGLKATSSCSLWWLNVQHRPVSDIAVCNAGFRGPEASGQQR